MERETKTKTHGRRKGMSERPKKILSRSSEKSKEENEKERERKRQIEKYLPHASMTFNNPHAIPSAPLRVKTTTLDAFVFSGCTHMLFERNGKAGRKRLD